MPSIFRPDVTPAGTRPGIVDMPDPWAHLAVAFKSSLGASTGLLLSGSHTWKRHRTIGYGTTVNCPIC
jgi:hypothetical protein